MKNQLPVISVAALFFLITGCRELPKDSEGHPYEFLCEKRPECNNRDGLVQIAYGTKGGKPDLTQSEIIVFCCDRLAQSIDSLKKYSDLMIPFNDSLKGRELSKEEFDDPGESVRKFIQAFYFGEDSICIDLSPVFIFDGVFRFKEMLFAVGNKRAGKIWLMFTGKKELDEYIRLLEDNYKNCCI